MSDAFRYAVDNGAKIINTSFNINGFVGNQTFTSGLQYLYDNGGLHFNSAGNSNEFNPARQEFHQTLLVANTNNFDVRHSSSNYGTGIDIAAPGVSILSTLPADGYGSGSGTSFSAPNAAGAAALIWSANPTWTRDQVAARLVGTADNIDAANPSLAGLLGRGRVNSAEAVSTTPLPAPQVEMVNGLPVNGSVPYVFGIGSFSISFNQIMDPPTINDANNFDLRGAGPDGTFDTADDVVYSLTYPAYMIGTNQVEFGVDSGSLAPDNYRLTVQSGGTQNPFGTDLDGDADGNAGGNFVQTFTVGPSMPVDFGDAPDTAAGTGAGNYETLAANDGPIHTIVAGLFLGDTVDRDFGTLQNARANADDVDGALPDDEDGVLSPFTDLLGTEGAAPTVTLLATNTTGSAGTLSGWIDYNNDGVFDNATERAQIAVPDSTTDGRFTLTFPTIPDGSAGMRRTRGSD